MQLSELKYITQDIIDESTINVTSSEMFAEVDAYNANVNAMRHYRQEFLYYYSVLIIMNFLSVFIGVFVESSSDFMDKIHFHNFSLMYNLTGNVIYPMILIAILSFLFFFLVIYKKIYDWRLGVLYALLIVPESTIMIFFSAVNPFLLYMLNIKDSKIKNEAGYPHFVELSVTYDREYDPNEDPDMINIDEDDEDDDDYDEEDEDDED